MTDAELEARARRAYEAADCTLMWENAREKYMRIARAVLEDPPADPFEEWWQRPTIGPWKNQEELAHAAWDAGVEHERQRCLKLVEEVVRANVRWAHSDVMLDLKELIKAGA